MLSIALNAMNTPAESVFLAPTPWVRRGSSPCLALRLTWAVENKAKTKGNQPIHYFDSESLDY
jgi:hypothetical protein